MRAPGASQEATLERAKLEEDVAASKAAVEKASRSCAGPSSPSSVLPEIGVLGWYAPSQKGVHHPLDVPW